MKLEWVELQVCRTSKRVYIFYTEIKLPNTMYLHIIQEENNSYSLAYETKLVVLAVCIIVLKLYNFSARYLISRVWNLLSNAVVIFDQISFWLQKKLTLVPYSTLPLYFMCMMSRNDLYQTWLLYEIKIRGNLRKWDFLHDGGGCIPH